MFSVAQKREISAVVEKVLLSFDHPEMPKERPVFELNVNGTTSLSYALIIPNWKYDDLNPPTVNPHNEAMDPESSNVGT
ncbi:MAG: hypothetical protein IH884_06060 [Myxococcales bacterium]|nr:hypothetical protein [Myxococcales bacterium]